MRLRPRSCESRRRRSTTSLDWRVIRAGPICLLVSLALAVGACAQTTEHGSTLPIGNVASSTTQELAITSTPPSDSVSLKLQLARAEKALEAFFYCMVDRGWELTRVGDTWLDGFESGGIPEEQWDAYQADDQECGEISGRADLGAPSVSVEEAGSLYDLFIGVADCVRGLGYDVPEAPSRQAFVDGLVSYPIPIWHPHELNGVWRPDLEEECPVPDWP